MLKDLGSFLFKREVFLVLLVIILSFFSFWRMLKPGIFSMHDFHIFRLFEYEKCIIDLQIPCRWSPDVSYQYGQPLFNFYGQFPYLVGMVFRSLGLSLLDSLKGIFIISLMGSAISMYFLAKRIWKDNLAGVLSAVIYLYAPYRAVDVYVRGALPEAFAFIFFPVIVLFLYRYITEGKALNLSLFAIFFSALIITHNLSALMFLFILAPLSACLFWRYRSLKRGIYLLISGVIISGLVAFYILPVVFENQFVTLGKTTSDYFDFHNHYVTLNQLLISGYWDYGGSAWGDDDRVSLAIGYMQWVLPLVVLLYILINKFILSKWSLGFKEQLFFVFLVLGWLMLFLTHNKSTFLWELFLPLKYIQFPWRFLGLGIFSFSLACGYLIILVNKFRFKVYVLSATLCLVIALNLGYFFEDLWFEISDKEQLSGSRFEQLISSSAYDYWPIYGKVLPKDKAFANPHFIAGEGAAVKIEKRSNEVFYRGSVESSSATIKLPQVYFPGWEARVNGRKTDIAYEEEMGLILINIPKGNFDLLLIFKDTPVRILGNYISLISIAIVLIITFKRNYLDRRLKI